MKRKTIKIIWAILAIFIAISMVAWTMWPLFT